MRLKRYLPLCEVTRTVERMSSIVYCIWCEAIPLLEQPNLVGDSRCTVGSTLRQFVRFLRRVQRICRHLFRQFSFWLQSTQAAFLLVNPEKNANCPFHYQRFRLSLIADQCVSYQCLYFSGQVNQSINDFNGIAAEMKSLSVRTSLLSFSVKPRSRMKCWNRHLSPGLLLYRAPVSYTHLTLPTILRV